MTDNVSMSPEQFAELLAAVRGGKLPAEGLGAAVAGGSGPRVLGLGCGDGGMGPIAVGVYQMLAAGSPRLALAKAYGIQMAPYTVNVRGIFSDTTTAVVPDVGSDVRFTQDTLIDSVNFRIFNESDTANQNVFQAQSDWYYTFQSGIEATLDVLGAPRYTVTPKYTPLANFCDAFNGSAKRMGGWVLNYNQALQMSFNAKVTIPTAPIEVVVTFNAFIPVWDELVSMTNREALNRLRDDCGIEISENYTRRCCR